MSEEELKVGDRVRIKGGPFAHFPATIESMSDDGLLLRAVVEIFGRETPLELMYCDVVKMKGGAPPSLSSNN